MLLSLFLQYFNQNLTISMGILVVYDILADRYKVEPSQLQTSIAIIAAPWAPKIFYGIIIDTLPIFGSTKKSYLILLGTTFACCTGACALIQFETYMPLVLLIMTTQISSAMMDVVVDGLAVV